MDRRIWIIFFIMFTNLLGVGIIFPFLPYYAERMGANTFTIGLLAVSYPFCSLISSPILGKLSDHLGRRKILLFSLLGTVLGFIFLGYAKTLPMLFLARIIDGISAGNTPTAFAYIADISSEEKRTHAISIVSSSFWIGSSIGFAFGGILSGYNYSLPGYCAAGIGAIGFLLAYFALPETVAQKSKKKNDTMLFSFPSITLAFSSSVLLGFLILVFIKELVWWSLDSTLSLLMQHAFLLQTFQTGLLFTYFGLIGVASQIVGLKLLLIFAKEKRIIEWCLFLIGIGLLCIANANTILIVLVGGTLCAIGSGMVNPLLTSLISKTSPKKDKGKTMGIMQAVDSFGTLIGPIVALWLYGIQMRLSYFTGALLSFIALLFSLIVITNNLKKSYQ